ncbi:hypothetical protein ACL02R_10505 [Streptomyces sp. MS19]
MRGTEGVRRTGERGTPMYVSLGTILLIVIIVAVVMMLRRS